MWEGRHNLFCLLVCLFIYLCLAFPRIAKELGKKWQEYKNEWEERHILVFFLFFPWIEILTIKRRLS